MPAPDQHVSLRPVIENDIKVIFDWQCVPETRQYARHPVAPLWDEHVKWWREALNTEGRSAFIIECDHKAAGLLRIDKQEKENRFEISILLDPEYYHKGIAAQALKLVRELRKNDIFMAYIKPENTASIKLFTSQDYEFIDNDWYQQLSKS